MEFYVLLLLASIPTVALALVCETYEQSSPLAITKTFSGINLGRQCGDGKSTHVGLNSLAWHVYEIEDTKEARIQIEPEGLLIPFVEDGILQFRHDAQFVDQGKSTFLSHWK